MTQPTPAEQLLNLADRAERGGLTGDEAQRLRDGISQMHGWLVTARAVARSNRQHVRAIVPEFDAATARAERAEAAIERVRKALEDMCEFEPHPRHDHWCPNDVRDVIRAALEPQEQQT